jgi:hypothetical protein
VYGSFLVLHILFSIVFTNHRKSIANELSYETGRKSFNLNEDDTITEVQKFSYYDQIGYGNNFKKILNSLRIGLFAGSDLFLD